MDWYLLVLKNYLGFHGRARRKEFWMFLLIDILIRIILGLVEYRLQVGFLSQIYSVLIFLPYVGVSMRRLHDTERSGWWLLLSFIPVIGTLVLLFFMAIEGTTGRNAYGQDPKSMTG